MKLLLDENLPHAFRHEFSGHGASTVAYLGWSDTKNGELLAKAAAAGFDALITLDSGVPYQHNIAALPVAVVVLSAATNDLDDLLPLVPQLLKTLESLQPRSIAYVP